jgi:hypothetical protein
MSTIAESILDAWPQVQTRCDFDLSTNTFKLGRIDPQPYGSRFMLGVVTLGDVARYGLRSAALETRSGKYVAPTKSSLSAAVRLAKQTHPYQPFTMNMRDLRSGNAYPGSMIVYTAARLQNLDRTDADKVAQFIRVSSTQGQRAGSGNGQLPQGFLPIRDSGVTKKLFVSAQQVAAAVAAQKAPASPMSPQTHAPAGPPATPSEGDLPRAAPTEAPPSDAPSATPSKLPPSDAAAAAMPPTQALSSRLSKGLIPALLLMGLLGLGLSAASRFFVRPPRRVR